MPVYQITWIFNGGRLGWSETWYANAETYDAAFAAASGITFRARQDLMGIGCSLEAVRISDTTILGDSRLRIFPPLKSATNADPADYAANALMLRVESASHSKRAMWLRGCPDVWIEASTTAYPRPILIDNAEKAIRAFEVAITTPPAFMLKVLDKTGEGGAGVAISNIGPAADGNVQITTANPLANVYLGGQLQLKYVKGPDAKLLNRTWRVVAVAGAVVEIDLLSVKLTGKNVGGKAYPKYFTYSAVTSCKLGKIGTRQTGRAFFVPLGRRVKKPI